MNFKPVARPQRTVLVKNNGKQYVYLTQGVRYFPELKQSRPVRVAIGKMNDEGLMIPNQNYYDIFGEEAELELPGHRADFVSLGLHLVIQKIAEKLNLSTLLESIFQEDSAKILDIAAYMLASENNVMQYFQDYGYHHSLFNGENFTDNTIGKLFKELSTKNIDLFIQAWVNQSEGKKIYIAYDSSNMNTKAGMLDLAEYGHAKDDPDLPQVNLAVGYNQTEQTPLFYELYPGSMIDNVECGKMVERAKRYGCKNVGFILDRGYFSIKNIRYFEENNFDYILMAKGNAKFIQEIITEYGAGLKNGYSYYLKKYPIYGMTIEKSLFETEKKQYIHLYYDGIRAENEKIVINKRYQRMDEELENRKKQKIQRKEAVAAYAKYYRLAFDENGYFINYQRKEPVLKNMIEKAGYFSIITTTKMEAEEALETYRDRDAVEKVFRMEKTHLGNDVFRVHTDDQLESKVFVSFIALIIRNEIYKSLKPLYQKNRKEYTVPKVIREYERLGLTKLSDHHYHLRYKLTSKQKKILKVIEITEKDYMAFAKDIQSALD